MLPYVAGASLNYIVHRVQFFLNETLRKKCSVSDARLKRGSNPSASVQFVMQNVTVNRVLAAATNGLKCSSLIGEALHD